MRVQQITAHLLAILLVLMGPMAIAQMPDDAIRIESIVARAMLARREAGNLTFAIDPRFGVSEHQREAASREARPEERNEALATALGGRILAFEDVRCEGCHLKGVAAHLTITAPIVTDSVATVNATLWQNSTSTREPTYYETIRFTLARTARGWVVTRRDQLGAS